MHMHQTPFYHFRGLQSEVHLFSGSIFKFLFPTCFTHTPANIRAAYDSHLHLTYTGLRERCDRKTVIKQNSRSKKKKKKKEIIKCVYVCLRVCDSQWLWLVSDPFRHWWMIVNIRDASWKAPGRKRGDIRRENTSVLCSERSLILSHVRAQWMNLNLLWRRQFL